MLNRFERQGQDLLERGRHALSEQPLHAVALSHDAGLIAAAGAAGVIYLLPLANTSGEVVVPRTLDVGLAGAEGGVFSLAFSDDGRLVAGCGDGSIWIAYLEGAADWENRTDNPEHGHGAPVRGLLFSAAVVDEHNQPLPRRLFSLAGDGVLKTWTLDSRRRPRNLEVGSGACAMALIPAAAKTAPESAGGTLQPAD